MRPSFRSRKRALPALPGGLLVALGLAVGPLALHAQDDLRPGVAVFEFEPGGAVGEGAMDMENLGIGIQAMLLNELTQNSSPRIVERRELNRVLQELELGQSGAVDPSTAAEAGKLVGARYMIFGSIADLFGEVVLTARVVEVETGELIRGAQEKAPRDDLYDVLVRTADQITRDLDLPPLEKEIREAREERDVPPGAVILLANAEAARDEGREDRAIELYQRLAREFPDYTDAQVALEQLLDGTGEGA